MKTVTVVIRDIDSFYDGRIIFHKLLNLFEKEEFKYITKPVDKCWHIVISKYDSNRLYSIAQLIKYFYGWGDDRVHFRPFHKFENMEPKGMNLYLDGSKDDVDIQYRIHILNAIEKFAETLEVGIFKASTMTRTFYEIRINSSHPTWRQLEFQKLVDFIRSMPDWHNIENNIWIW